MRQLIFILSILFYSCGQHGRQVKVQLWEKQAGEVTIIRDQWGIPHVFGKSDADAVFGLTFAQCEDDFNRVEVNYINAMGRMAEVEGEASLMSDLRMHLFMDTTKAAAIYKDSPDWMKKLLNAFADGANYYLHTHPDTKPKLITRFQPWMPLMFSEGSIGGDIETISLSALASFYDAGNETASIEPASTDWGKEPTGSNGFALAPSRSATGNSLFLINPHTSFYFRPEVHMVSGEGLNAYGAVTWGQFFVYQGFNERCGWMHTSSRADAIDEYEETVVKEGEELFYRYDNELQPIGSEKVTLAYSTGTGLVTRDFTIYRTHHGHVIANRDGKWISIKLMQEPLKALTQSFMRTKATGYEEFKKTMDMKTNSSNNTVYADADGNIAYFHGNFIPVRDAQFDWSRPVDGSNPATEWKGLHSVEETVHTLNPVNGWIQNCNATPFTVSGDESPDKSKYPPYMAPDAENFRGIHAVRVLKDSTNFTLEKLIAAAYDSYLPAFEVLIPSLLKAYEKTPGADVKEAVDFLRSWDFRFSENSVATAVAIYWAGELRKSAGDALPPRYDPIAIVSHLVEKTSSAEKMEALRRALATLKEDFGQWQTPWGEINRFQRLSGNIIETFDDDKPSIPVGFTSSFWGSLASYGSKAYPNTKKWYGTSGNSFVAVVEFGKKITAKSILAGGVSGDPRSAHFNDQAERYGQGKFKEVQYYREDIEKNAQKTYHPGQAQH